MRLKNEYCNEMLFDRSLAEAFYGSPPESAGRFYDDDRGMVVRSEVDDIPFYQDLIQFDPDAVAFTGKSMPRPLPFVGHHFQTIEGGDWLHFCLRLGGRGTESIKNYASIDQPIRSCIVTRYPTGSRIERVSSPDDGWRTACLWLRPAALLRFLETSASRIPEHLSTFFDPGHLDTPRHFSLPLDARMISAVDDVLDCPFTGGTRRAFIRSRYLEILALIYQASVTMPDKQTDAAATLTPATQQAIARAAALVSARLDRMDTLDDIAREVGISRTRLTHGFRALMGKSVEGYWQEKRMTYARQRLCQDTGPISDLAHELGYSELASFSRAFSQNFGKSPSRMRAEG